MDFLNSWAGQRVLVTGASGFLGKHVVSMGLEAGLELHTASRCPGVASGQIPHVINLCSAKEVMDLIISVVPDAVIHLAATGVSHGSDTFHEMLDTNVNGLNNLLEAVCSADLHTKVIIAGTGFEYGIQERSITETDPLLPFSHYGISKVAATNCARLYSNKIDITILRLFSLYGPNEAYPRLLPYLITRTQQRQPVELTFCEQLRDYMHIRDAAECFWRALTLPRSCDFMRVINIGSGKTVTLRYLIELAASCLQEKGYEPILCFGAKPYRPAEPMIYIPNISKMQNEFGWTPETELREGVYQTIKSMTV